MKTLNKNITKDFFATAEEYVALEARWRELMNDSELRKKLHCSHHLLYAMLRGKNWQKGLTAPTNAKKVENGALVGWLGKRAFLWVQQADIDRLIAPFAGTVTDSAVIRMRNRLPECNYYDNPLEKEPYLD